MNYRDANTDEIYMWEQTIVYNPKSNRQVDFDDWLGRYRKLAGEMKRVHEVNERRQKRRIGL